MSDALKVTEEYPSIAFTAEQLKQIAVQNLNNLRPLASIHENGLSEITYFADGSDKVEIVKSSLKALGFTINEQGNGPAREVSADLNVACHRHLTTDMMSFPGHTITIKNKGDRLKILAEAGVVFPGSQFISPEQQKFRISNNGRGGRN